jgi:D-glycero-D-manno-heptose 1,7-bisphosphate phosphatase
VTDGRAAVFFDRDGTLIWAPAVDGRPGSIRSVDELELEEGAAEGCAALRGAGYLLVMVTNQPEIARGTVTREAVDAMHERIRELLPLDDVRMCPHDDADDCPCRKPKPGMLFDAARELDIDLRRSFMVGDRWKDVEAGQRAGCRTVFLDRQYSEPMPVRPDATVRDLGEAIAWILEQTDR